LALLILSKDFIDGDPRTLIKSERPVHPMGNLEAEPSDKKLTANYLKKEYYIKKQISSASKMRNGKVKENPRIAIGSKKASN